MAEHGGFDVGEGVDLAALYPSMRAKLALIGLAEVIGLMDMVLQRQPYSDVREGWEARLIEVVDYCLTQVQEITEFGSAFDPE